MMKLLNWLTQTLIIAVIVSCVSVVTTFLMVNVLVQQLTEQLGIGSVISPISFSALFQSPSALEQTSAWETESMKESRSPNRSQDIQPGAADQHTLDREQVPENALPVMGHADFGNAGIQAEWYLSMEEIIEAKESLTDEERAKIFSMLITKVPPDEVQIISTLLEGGLDAQEMSEAAAILQKHLTEEEYETLQDMLLKSNDNHP